VLAYLRERGVRIQLTELRQEAQANDILVVGLWSQKERSALPAQGVKETMLHSVLSVVAAAISNQ